MRKRCPGHRAWSPVSVIPNSLVAVRALSASDTGFMNGVVFRLKIDVKPIDTTQVLSCSHHGNAFNEGDIDVRALAEVFVKKAEISEKAFSQSVCLNNIERDRIRSLLNHLILPDDVFIVFE